MQYNSTNLNRNWIVASNAAAKTFHLHHTNARHQFKNAGYQSPSITFIRDQILYTIQ